MPIGKAALLFVTIVLSGCAGSDTEHSGLFKFIDSREQKWGFIDREGRFVVIPQFEAWWWETEGSILAVGEFKGGLAAVTTSRGEFAYVNEEGMVVWATTTLYWFAVMKSDLKNLASQQEIYYSANYSYTTSKSDLAFTTFGGVDVAISASSNGGAASATHSALGSSQGCAIYYGTATAPTVGTATPLAPGVIACTN